ncbi:universal stress protein [Streptomyces sp. WMMC500]|uniref:universal stress protein n=1 Tax=Streptomyces sp. WMMC500 TaxID=3015154 RepID=UPI00248CA33B|nr:universal stress protein [Streptomyces sp. WMMC500]WBB62366.1 universal stress protein [Streptomyces sp. WMMC500]
METSPVVAGVDGSAASLDAVAVAAREAKLRGCGLRVVHAFLWPAFGAYPGSAAMLPGDTALRDEAEKVVADAVAHARETAPGVRADGALVTGEVVRVLVEETENAQLAVVAGRGLGAFVRLLVGSTAAALSAYGHCPVLVVRGGGPGPGGPVLLAVDGSPAGAAAVDFAFAEAARRDAGLVAMHVWSAWTRYSPRAGNPARTAAEGPAAEGDRVLAEAVAGAETAYPGVRAERTAVEGSARELLIEASKDAGLLVTGARGHGGFAGLLLGSVSHALLQHAHCPVAVVRGAGERP